MKKLQYDSSYLSYLFNYCKNTLNESRHIVTDFLNLINWLSVTLSKFKIDLIIYTGWNYHIINAKCTNDNNSNSGYPIYVIIDSNIDNETFAYVEDRDLHSNKIILHINANNINDTDIKSKLKHEFTHIKTAYSNFYKDPLDQKKIKYNIKDVIYFINIKIKQYSFDKFKDSLIMPLFGNHFYDAAACLCYMSETEQEARINLIYQYIVDKYANKKTFDKKSIINEVKDISLLPDFIDAAESYKNCNNTYAFKKVLCLAYYLNLLGCITYNILNDKDLMLEYFNVFNGATKKYEEKFVFPLNKTVNYVYNNLIEYELKILFIIDDAICDILLKSIK